MHCTRHRVFLATLIVAAKYLNGEPGFARSWLGASTNDLSLSDSSPKNKHWTRYSGLFSSPEVNLMERQLLFLLDYDLRMDESELLTHFEPFLRRPVASTSSLRPRSLDASPIAVPAQYPTTPRRAHASSQSKDAGLLTPSPSPRRPTHISSSNPSRRSVPAYQQRVSPTASSSSGETMSDDLSSEESCDDMDLSPNGHSRQSSYPFCRSSRPGPVTPTDQQHPYATPPSSSSPPRSSRVDPALRSQRSGSFLRMTYEAGKGMLHFASKPSLREGVAGEGMDVRIA